MTVVVDLPHFGCFAFVALALDDVIHGAFDSCAFRLEDAARNVAVFHRKFCKILHDSVDFDVCRDGAFPHDEVIDVVVFMNAELLAASVVVVAHPKRRVFVAFQAECFALLDVFDVDSKKHD